MTTIVMIQKPEYVVVGWDNAITRGNEIQDMMTDKVFVKAGIILGVAGMARANDIIELAEIPDYDGSDPRRWLISVFRPIVAPLLKAEPGLYDHDSARYDMGLLAVVGGQAFSFDTSLTPVQYASGEYATGSGQDYALGVMAAGGTAIDALMAARKLDPNTGGALIVKSSSLMLEQAARVGDTGETETDRYAVEEELGPIKYRTFQWPPTADPLSWWHQQPTSLFPSVTAEVSPIDAALYRAKYGVASCPCGGCTGAQ